MVANNAGMPATPADLINVDEVIGKYYDVVPDPNVPEQRVSFGTSGHRGSSLKTSFNEAHIVAITQAIAEYRKKAGVTGPLYIGRDTHALSEPAWKTAIEVLVANGVTVRIDSRDDFTPDPGCVPGHPDPQPRSGWHPALHRRRPGRRHRGDPVAQPADRWRLQV